MKKYQSIFIGFGKGAKTLAEVLAKNGETIAMIESSEKMYGGTCINVACIPSKFLENEARFSAKLEGDFKIKANFYKNTIQRKREVIAKLRDKNYHKLADFENVDVLTGTASFIDSNHIIVKFKDRTEDVIEGEKIFINTGARPFIPPIEGLKDSEYFYVSETMMELERLPQRLVILGGGYIGIEFASYYANFGSDVTIIQNGSTFLPREDEEMAKIVLKSFMDRGIHVLQSTKIVSVQDQDGYATITVNTEEGEQKLEAEAILVATGRRPNIEALHLENAGIELTDRGAIKTDEHLHTTAKNVWAMGDVTGDLQFTYISLDDSRIVKSELLGDGNRTIKNRGAIPYSIFIDPSFSRVGLTEKEAREKGYSLKIAKLAVSTIPKAQILENPTGYLKAIIDADTDRILGAHLFCVESHEMINMIKVVMDAGLPYTILRDGIFTHPTISEAYNNLFSTI